MVVLCAEKQGSLSDLLFPQATLLRLHRSVIIHAVFACTQDMPRGNRPRPARRHHAINRLKLSSRQRAEPLLRKTSGTRGCGRFLGDSHAAIPWL